MDTAGLVINIVLAATGIAAAIVAVIQARVAVQARREAKTAQLGAEHAEREAIALARKANEAFERQAAAQEEANVLAKAALPKDEVRWLYEHVSGARYVLQNVGTVVAQNSLLTDIGEPTGFIRPDEEVRRDIAPGDSLEFMVCSAFGAPRPRFRVTWREDGLSDELHDDTTVTVR
ncbi:hypothetical protein E3T40_07190 [Cryobacterium sp. TMT1-19]|uniref:hypothetical protein n=1 Tax=Cryobacterium sp. TMT1-19 TaxID=1259231 RepID=UPI00106A16FA|nr:hypothetical protein [Cryobacterium sp. TMT1-19]TFD35935.1 hypothetical protein E3T40_07190 [Cryobacterium sp. TMT1-19]